MIRLKQISKEFKSGIPILENLDLTIPRGERTVVIGPSGCGKSTLLRMIMGLHFPDFGQVMIEDQDLTQLNEKKINQVRLRMGMLFQSGALFDSLNVEDNIAFSLRENFSMEESKIKKRIKETLELVEMEGRERAMPSDLSGGQRKRIGLARAIAHRPDIVLYDEPTTGLDPILSTKIEDLIVRLSEEMKITSVIVTHQVSTILRTSDKIYLMKNKRLIAPETPDRISKSKNKDYRTFIHGGLEAND